MKNLINLTDSISVKEMKLEKGQFKIPKQFFVDLDTVKEKYAYAMVNGENQRTDRLESYTFKAYDSQVYELMKNNNLDVTTLKPIQIFLSVDNTDSIERLKMGQHKIELIEFSIILGDWSQLKKQYTGVKIEAEKIKFVEEK